MNKEELKEKIEKLPKWAQEHITKLDMQRDEAIKALNESVDTQTESSFYHEEMLNTGERIGPTIKKFYIQAHKMTVFYAGICIGITCIDDDYIRLSYEEDFGKGHSFSHAVMTPVSFQQLEFRTVKNCRTRD